MPVVEAVCEVLGVVEAKEVIVEVTVTSVLLPLGRILVVVIIETVALPGTRGAPEVEVESVAVDDKLGEVELLTEVPCLPEVVAMVIVEGPAV